MIVGPLVPTGRSKSGSEAPCGHAWVRVGLFCCDPRVPAKLGMVSMPGGSRDRRGTANEMATCSRGEETRHDRLPNI